MRLGTIFFALWLVMTVNGALGAPARTNEIVRLQGRVSQFAGSGTNLVFKCDSGKQFKLERNPYSEAVFLDTNIWTRVLLLTGKEHGKSFEVTGGLRSVKSGKVYELFYYCDICSISSSLPGLCQCCRKPTVLTERTAH